MPHHTEDVRRPEATSPWGALLQPGLRPRPCALTAANLPLSSWDQADFKGQQGSRKR